MQFNGSVAVVTGGNSATGRGIVQRIVREGAAEALVGRNPIVTVSIRDGAGQ